MFQSLISELAKECWLYLEIIKTLTLYDMVNLYGQIDKVCNLHTKKKNLFVCIWGFSSVVNEGEAFYSVGTWLSQMEQGSGQQVSQCFLIPVALPGMLGGLCLLKL